jgi:hypothetical protein
VPFFEDDWNEQFGEVQVQRYHQYFPRPPGAIAGEWTPRYMLDPWTPPRLSRAAPEARVLVLLRDPLARLRSGLRHMKSANSGELAAHLVNEALAFGRYGEQLELLACHFPRGQILVLQFERCVQDPDGERMRTFAFLGVDEDFVPEGFHDPVNEARGPEFAIPADIVDRARELYLADAGKLADWGEIDLDLWPELTG